VNRRGRAARSIGLAVAACWTPASAQTVATEPVVKLPAHCTFSKPAQLRGSLREAPEIAAEFKRHNLAIADVGEPYVPFDVIDSSKELPHRQFLRAYVFADRTIVWYYHGGFAAHVHVSELRAQSDRRDAAPVQRFTRQRLIGPPCEATEALLRGVSGTDDW
jgi:hypothetical protein